jgi:hypothetical protein
VQGSDKAQGCLMTGFCEFGNEPSGSSATEKLGIICLICMQRSATVGMPAARSAFPRSSPRLMLPPPPAHLSVSVRLTTTHVIDIDPVCLFIAIIHVILMLPLEAICSIGQRRHDKFKAWEYNIKTYLKHTECKIHQVTQLVNHQFPYNQEIWDIVWAVVCAVESCIKLPIN